MSRSGFLGNKLSCPKGEKTSKKKKARFLSQTDQSAALIPGSWAAPASGGVGPAEDGGHVAIGHALLLGHAHGPAQVNGQDVFALEEEQSTGMRRDDADPALPDIRTVA